MTNVEENSRFVEAADAEEETYAAEAHVSLNVEDDIHDEVEQVRVPSPFVRSDVGKENPKKSSRGRQSHGLEREDGMLDDSRKY